MHACLKRVSDEKWQKLQLLGWLAARERASERASVWNGGRGNLCMDGDGPRLPRVEGRAGAVGLGEAGEAVVRGWEPREGREGGRGDNFRECERARWRTLAAPETSTPTALSGRGRQPGPPCGAEIPARAPASARAAAATPVAPSGGGSVTVPRSTPLASGLRGLAALLPLPVPERSPRPGRLSSPAPPTPPATNRAVPPSATGRKLRIASFKCSSPDVPPAPRGWETSSQERLAPRLFRVDGPVPRDSDAQFLDFHFPAPDQVHYCVETARGARESEKPPVKLFLKSKLLRTCLRDDCTAYFAPRHTEAAAETDDGSDAPYEGNVENSRRQSESEGSGVGRPRSRGQLAATLPAAALPALPKFSKAPPSPLTLPTLPALQLPAVPRPLPRDLPGPTPFLRGLPAPQPPAPPPTAPPPPSAAASAAAAAAAFLARRNGARREGATPRLAQRCTPLRRSREAGVSTARAANSPEGRPLLRPQQSAEAALARLSSAVMHYYAHGSGRCSALKRKGGLDRRRSRRKVGFDAKTTTVGFARQNEVREIETAGGGAGGDGGGGSGSISSRSRVSANCFANGLACSGAGGGAGGAGSAAGSAPLLPASFISAGIARCANAGGRAVGPVFGSTAADFAPRSTPRTSHPHILTLATPANSLHESYREAFGAPGGGGGGGGSAAAGRRGRPHVLARLTSSSRLRLLLRSGRRPSAPATAGDLHACTPRLAPGAARARRHSVHPDGRLAVAAPPRSGGRERSRRPVGGGESTGGCGRGGWARSSLSGCGAAGCTPRGSLYSARAWPNSTAAGASWASSSSSGGGTPTSSAAGSSSASVFLPSPSSSSTFCYFSRGRRLPARSWRTTADLDRKAPLKPPSSRPTFRWSAHGRRTFGRAETRRRSLQAGRPLGAQNAALDGFACPLRHAATGGGKVGAAGAPGAPNSPPAGRAAAGPGPPFRPASLRAKSCVCPSLEGPALIVANADLQLATARSLGSSLAVSGRLGNGGDTARTTATTTAGGPSLEAQWAGTARRRRKRREVAAKQFQRLCTRRRGRRRGPSLDSRIFRAADSNRGARPPPAAAAPPAALSREGAENLQAVARAAIGERHASKFTGPGCAISCLGLPLAAGSVGAARARLQVSLSQLQLLVSTDGGDGREVPIDLREVRGISRRRADIERTWRAGAQLPFTRPADALSAVRLEVNSLQGAAPAENQAIYLTAVRSRAGRNCGSNITTAPETAENAVAFPMRVFEIRKFPDEKGFRGGRIAAHRGRAFLDEKSFDDLEVGRDCAAESGVANRRHEIGEATAGERTPWGSAHGRHLKPSSPLSNDGATVSGADVDFFLFVFESPDLASAATELIVLAQSFAGITPAAVTVDNRQRPMAAARAALRILPRRLRAAMGDAAASINERSTVYLSTGIVQRAETQPLEPLAAPAARSQNASHFSPVRVPRTLSACAPDTSTAATASAAPASAAPASSGDIPAPKPATRASIFRFSRSRNAYSHSRPKDRPKAAHASPPINV